MPTKQKNKVLRLSGFIIFSIFFCLCITSSPGISGIFSYNETTVEKQAPASGEELKTTGNDSSANAGEEDENATLDFEIPGMAALFGSMLDSLLAASVNSEDQFRSLAAGFPLILPDLHKVFLTL